MPLTSAAVTAHQGAVMPTSIAPPRVHSPSSGSDHVIIGAIAFSSGGLAGAAIHWVLPK